MTMTAKKRQTMPVPAGKGSRLVEAGALALRVGEREVEIPAEGSLTIGSDPDTAGLVIDDRYVSGAHCRIFRRGRRIILSDPGSTNGTYVNGVRVRELDVERGARISLGETTLTLVVPGSRDARPAIEQLVGEDPAFRSAIEDARRAARSSASVVIRGESGTGKDLVARVIHEESRRAHGPFVAVNCSAISPELVESELFGHERGAFTGAVDRRAGLFEQAHGGTLFLDEIGDLPLAQQPRLLRVLESRRVRRVGGEGEREIDVRVVGATHKDLVAATRDGAFRADLFHRLCQIQLRVPPLRARPGDIPLLIRAFLAEHGVPDDAVQPSTMRILVELDWHGNVRELRNAVARAVAMASGDRLELPHFLPDLPLGRSVLAASQVSEPQAPYDVEGTVRAALEKHGTVRAAAKALDIPKSTLHDLARKHGLLRRRRPKP
jgi:DNA-binding NtrC family response regulator